MMSLSEVTVAAVTRMGLLDMQVCVPNDWTDEQATEFANAQNPTGVQSGWSIRKAGNEHLAGDPERRPCSLRVGFVHIMLDA